MVENMAHILKTAAFLAHYQRKLGYASKYVATKEKEKLLELRAPLKAIFDRRFVDIENFAKEESVIPAKKRDIVNDVVLYGTM